MRRLVAQAARWHQRGAPELFTASTARCRFPRDPPRRFCLRQYATTRDGGGGDKIRLYEQIGRNAKKRVRVDGDKEVHEVAAKLKAEIDQLDQELEEMRKGPFDPNNEFMRSLSEDERNELLQIMQDGDLQEQLKEIDSEMLRDDEMDYEEIDRLIKEEEDEIDAEEAGRDVEAKEETPRASIPTVTLEIPKDHQAYALRFNACLKAVAQDSSDETKNNLMWKIYIRCKQKIPNFLPVLPQEAWEIIWASQSEANSHLTILAEDQKSMGKTLSGTQWLTYIEGLHLDGQTEEALRQWESQQDILASQSELADQFWDLGVRLLTALDRPQEAQRAATYFLETHEAGDPRVLLHVIAAWSKSPNADSAQKAWTLYLQLKSYLRDALDEQDYDIISTAFLLTKRANMALAVFKDMILSQQNSPYDSSALYRKALGYVGDLQAASVDEQEVNKVSIAALTTLPRFLQNKFFYGSWIKKLIGFEEVDAAAAVVELMYERGVRPDPKPLNGMIGAWLRKGDALSREKAERMGWAMIQQRIAFVAKRQNSPFSMASGDIPQAAKVAPEKFDQGLRIPSFLQRTVPSATIETFSILLLHYTRLNQDHLAAYLLETMNQAQVAPNSFIMNHILYSLLRKHSLTAVWGKYQEMTKTIQSDLETFACLWDCGKVQYSSSTAAKSSFPPATTLFREMNLWFQSLSTLQQAKARSEMSSELYDQIIRCFCLSKDLKGTIVALNGLEQLFDMHPSTDTTTLIVMQLSRLLPQDRAMRIPVTSRPRRLGGNPNSQAQIAKVTSVLDTIRERREVALIAAGIDAEDLTEQEIGAFDLGALCELLVTVLRRIGSPDGNLANELKLVANWMAVEDVSLEDIEGTGAAEVEPETNAEGQGGEEGAEDAASSVTGGETEEKR